MPGAQQASYAQPTARMAEWQTRRPQKPLSERACGFKSRSGHVPLSLYVLLCPAQGARQASAPGPAPRPTYPRRRPGHRSTGNLLPACAPKTVARAGISMLCPPHLTRRSAGRVRARFTGGCTTPVALRGKQWAVHPLQYPARSNGLGAIFPASSWLPQLVRTVVSRNGRCGKARGHFGWLFRLALSASSSQPPTAPEPLPLRQRRLPRSH